MLILAATLAPVAADAADWPKYKIQVTDFKDTETERAILAVAVEVEEEINRVTDHEAALIHIRLVPGTGCKMAGPNLLLVGWPESMPGHAMVPHLARVLLLRRLLQYNRKRPVDPAVVPEWLVAGVTHRVNDREGRIVAVSIFPAVRAAVLGGNLPTLRSMVELAPTPLDGPVYLVYSEYNAVLLRSIIRDDRHAIDRMLKEWDPKGDPYEALVAVLPEAARRDSPTDWFRRRLELAGVWHLMPSSYEYAAAELESLRTISIMAPGDGGIAQVRTIDLVDLTEESLNYFHSSGAFNTITYKLKKLQTVGPPLVRPAAAEYVRAISYFKDGKMKKFHEALREARTQAAAAVARGQAIQELLDYWEYGPEHSPHLRLVRHQDMILHGLGPTAYEQAVTTYLDDLEARHSSALR